ncbi:carbohydrate sulfotransferase 11-like isoform X2 [Palaemon carinicauda]
MTTSPTCNWLCRRNGVILLSVFFFVQWGLRLWISRLLVSEPLRAPKPISAFTTFRNLLNDVSVQDNLQEAPLKHDVDSRHLDQTTPKLSSSISSNDLSGYVMNSSHPIFTDQKKSFKKWKRTMKERTRTVREGCSKYGSILKRFNNHRRLLFDTKHHIAYCRNAKAGTTTWLGELLGTAGVNTTGLTPEQIHEEASKIFPPLPPKVAAKEMDKLSLLFTVVRHPFTRLVSAYRDKIPEKYRADLQQKMIDRYRGQINNRQQDQNKQRNVKPSEDPSLPTFREFVLFVSDEILSCEPFVNSACLQLIDPHWRPIYDRCAPCDFHYDVIAKVETFYEDQKYIRELTGLSNNSSDMKANGLPRAHSSKGPSSVKLTKEYFSLLSEEDKDRVYKAYFFDFYLFGYSPDVII